MRGELRIAAHDNFIMIKSAGRTKTQPMTGKPLLGASRLIQYNQNRTIYPSSTHVDDVH